MKNSAMQFSFPPFSTFLALMSYFCRPVDNYPFSWSPPSAILNQEAIGGICNFIVIVWFCTHPHCLLSSSLFHCLRWSSLCYCLDCDSSISKINAVACVLNCHHNDRPYQWFALIVFILVSCRASWHQLPWWPHVVIRLLFPLAPFRILEGSSGQLNTPPNWQR